MKRYQIFVIAVLTIVTVILLYPGKIPYSLRVTGRVSPCREWIITRGRDGLVIATLHDYVKGKKESYFASQFERGDAVQFTIHETIKTGAFISRGDTVGWIDSSGLEQRLVTLTGELETQKALLRSAETGEKESVVNEAQKRVEHAHEQLEEQKKMVERLKNLHETHFIPYQDLEIARSTLNLYIINLQIAETQLQSVETGVKKEEIEMIVSHINSLEEEIKTLHNMSDKYTFISPISGTVLEINLVINSEINLEETILDIGNINEYIVQIPIQLNNRQLIKLNQDMRFKIDGFREKFQGKIFKLGNTVHIVNGKQVFLVTASIKTGDQNLFPGTIIRCTIPCNPLTPLEYIRRFITSIL